MIKRLAKLIPFHWFAAFTCTVWLFGLFSWQIAIVVVPILTWALAKFLKELHKHV